MSYSLTIDQVKECFAETVCEKVCEGVMYSYCKGPDYCDQFESFFVMLESVAVINQIDRILNKK